MPGDFMTAAEKLSYDREVEVLQIVNHPFVIKYKDSFIYSKG